MTLTAAVERRTVAPIITGPDVADLPELVLYPLADQVTDKVCAMYERHGPDQLPSSRYRDLVDLALIVGNFDLDAAERRYLGAGVRTPRPAATYQHHQPRPGLGTALSSRLPAARCYRRNGSSWRLLSPWSAGAWTRR